MYTLAVIVLDLVLITAGWLLYQGWTDRRDPTAPHKPARTLLLLQRIPPRTRMLATIGVALGATGWLLTGWAVCILVAPLALAGIPYVFGQAAAVDEIDKLSALEEWVRNLAGVTAVGSGLEQAIISTERTLPARLRPDLTRMITRLRTNTPVADVLRRFADDVDDATADSLVAALLQSAALRGPGLTSVLEALSKSIAEDVRNRRKVEAERKQPRATVRYATIIIAGLLTYLFVLTDYMQPYRRGAMPLLLLGFFLTFLGCLVWMRIIARTRTRARFIGTRTRRPTTTTRQPAGTTP